MSTYWFVDKRVEKNRQTGRKTNIRPDCTCMQTNRRFLPFTKRHVRAQAHWQQRDLFFLASFESMSKPDKFNRCKNKASDGGREWTSTSSVSQSPSRRSHLCSLLGCLSGRLQWEYWMKGLFYPASQPSRERGIWMEGAAWLQALIPGCYDRASGWEFWRASSRGPFLQLRMLSWEELPSQQLSDLQFQMCLPHTHTCTRTHILWFLCDS